MTLATKISGAWCRVGLVWVLAAGSAQAQLAFSDQTDSSGLKTFHITVGAHTPIKGAEHHWRFGGAVACGDFNKDGWIDVFVTAGGRAADRLFINNQDGTFTDVAESAGVDGHHQGTGIAVGDYDNDGNLDIYVMSHGDPIAPAAGQHKLYRNNGDLTFSEVAAQAGVSYSSPNLYDGTGAAFGDYDLDGDLDLYVCGWRGTRDNPDGLGNRLFQNTGAGTFIDVTEAANVWDKDLFAFSPTFADMDRDGWPDLPVAADLRSSRYFRNNRDGTFTNLTPGNGTGQDVNGMGSAVGDLNNDGLLDWYVTSVYAPVQPSNQDGNKLYMNLGNHEFAEVAASAGVNNGHWGWGTVIVDLDHDGWQDIVETNGWQFVYAGNPSKVWINDGTGLGYSEVSQQIGLIHIQSGRAVASCDYDNDGDQDILIASNWGYLQLFRNELSGPDTNWLRVFLDTSTSANKEAPGGIGAYVEATAGSQTYTRCIDAGSHNYGQSELSAHFGLAGATVVDALTITWTDGQKTVLTQVPVNQTLTVSAPP